jgi:hypothetical protein
MLLLIKEVVRMFNINNKKIKTVKHTYTDTPVQHTPSMFTKDVVRGGVRPSTPKPNPWVVGAFVA